MNRKPPSTGTVPWLAVGIGLGLAACSSPRWDVTSTIRAPDVDVATALGDTSSEDASGLAAADIPEIALPHGVRPCCVFGTDLEVEIGFVPVPGVELGNLLGPDDLGAHRYDNGFLSMQPGDPRGRVSDEKNGLVYTCRGGFIDVAHVRDNADLTLAIAAALARTLESGSTIEVPPQGAVTRLRVRPIAAATLAARGRIPIAVELAQWLAYQLSIWHEIATFYGYTGIAGWPEKLSAFSPEDLYSNELGIRLAGGILLAKGARSDLEYGLSMDAWLERALRRLGAVPVEDSRSAMLALDGAWWDSAKRIPDWTLVKRRQLDTGPVVRPWRLEDAKAGTHGVVTPVARCASAAPALAFRLHEDLAGVPFRDLATVELEVDDALVEGGFPLPRPGSRLVTQDDFPAIIAAVRHAIVETFGSGSDAP